MRGGRCGAGGAAGGEGACVGGAFLWERQRPVINTERVACEADGQQSEGVK